MRPTQSDMFTTVPHSQHVCEDRLRQKVTHTNVFSTKVHIPPKKKSDHNYQAREVSNKAAAVRSLSAHTPSQKRKSTLTQLAALVTDQSPVA